MTRDQLLADLERERVRDFDALPQERYRHGAVERIAGLLPPYTPVAPDQADRNREVLAEAFGVRDTYEPA